MKAFFKTFPILALAFATSCKKADAPSQNSPATTATEKTVVSKDDLDFEVLALGPSKDTLFHIITDNFKIESTDGYEIGDGKTFGGSQNNPTSYMTETGVLLFEKGTNLPYAATAGTTVVFRPVPLTIQK